MHQEEQDIRRELIQPPSHDKAPAPAPECRPLEELVHEAQSTLGNNEVSQGLLNRATGLSEILKSQMNQAFEGFLPKPMSNSELVRFMLEGKGEDKKGDPKDQGISLGSSHDTGEKADGIERRSETTARAGWSPDEGLSIHSGYEHHLTDRDEYSDTKSLNASFENGKGSVTATGSSSVKDSAGQTTAKSTTGGFGYGAEGGFFGWLGIDNSTKDKEGSQRQKADLRFEDGALSAHLERGSQTFSEDGETRDASWGLSSSASLSKQELSGTRTHGYESDGIKGGNSVTGTIGHDSEKGSSFALKATSGLEDGEEYHDRLTGNVGYKDGTFSADMAQDLRSTDESGVRTDQHTSSTFSHGPDGTTFGLKRGSGTLDDEVGSSSSTSGTVKFGPDGQSSLKLNHDRTAGIDDEYGGTKGLSVEIGSNGAAVGMTTSSHVKEENGITKTEGTSGTIGIKDGHLNAGGQTSWGEKGPDGSSETSAGIGLSTDGTVSGSLSTTKKDADGNVTGGYSGSGSLKMTQDQFKVSASAGKQFKGGRSVHVNGGYSFEVSEPRMIGEGQWQVEYQQSLNGSVGGGQSAGTKTTGAASANVGGQIVSGGARLFASEEEARAFYSRPDVGLMQGPTADIDATLAMGVGDQQHKVHAVSVGGNLSANAKLLNAGLGGTHGQAGGLTVTRGSDSKVTVQLDDSTTQSATANLSTVGAGLSGGRSVNDTESVVWEFDLAQPEAQAAYGALVTDGATPTEAPGVRRLRTTDSETKQADRGFHVGFFSVSANSGMSTSETTYLGGDKTEQDKGFTQIDASFLGYHHSESHSLTLKEFNDADRSMTSRSTVEASNARATHAGLARAAGIDGAANLAEGEVSGRWTHETVFPESALNEFVELVGSGDYNPYDVFGGSGHDLVKLMAQADGDPDLERKAVAAFVEAGGDRALADLRRHTQGGESFLQLEGSDTFTGVEGHRAFEQELGRLEHLVAQGQAHSAEAFQGAQALHTKETARARDLQDFGRYADLPPQLRQDELSRVRANLAQIEAVMLAATAGLAEAGQADAILLPDLVIKGGDNLADAQESATKVHAEMEDSYTTARSHRQKHDLGDQRMRKRVGSSGFLGWFQGAEYHVYAQIDEMWPTAEADRRSGTDEEQKAREVSLLSVDTATQAIPFWRSAERAYGEAQGGFDGITEHYDGIWSRNGGR